MNNPKIADVRVGMVFDTGSITNAGEKNFARVTQRPFFENKGDRPDIFYVVFVDPKNFKKKRLPNDREFAVWDFNYENDGWKRVK